MVNAPSMEVNTLDSTVPSSSKTKSQSPGRPYSGSIFFSIAFIAVYSMYIEPVIAIAGNQATNIVKTQPQEAQDSVELRKLVEILATPSDSWKTFANGALGDAAKGPLCTLLACATCHPPNWS